MREVLYTLLCLTLLSQTLTQNWNWVYISESPETDNPLAVRQNAYAAMIPFNWNYDQDFLDENTPYDVYWLRTFAQGPIIEIGYIAGFESNIFSPANGGLFRPPYRVVSDVFTINIAPVFPNSLLGHTLTQVVDSRQPKFQYIGVNYGGLTGSNDTVNTQLHIIQVQDNPSFNGIDLVDYPRVFHSAVVVPSETTIGTLFVWGGMSAISNGQGVFTDTLIRIDLPLLTANLSDVSGITADDVSQSGNIPSPRAGHSAVFHEGNMIIFGGINGNSTLGTIFSCNMNSDPYQWTEFTEAPFQRAFHSATLVQDRIYIFGGVADDEVQNDFWYYDITSDEWNEVVLPYSIPPRAGHTAFLHRNSILIQGGSDNENVLDDWWFLDLDLPLCQYFCEDIRECVSGPAECNSYRECEDNAIFKCNGGCVESHTDCELLEDCPSGSVECWDGLCADTIGDCTPFPSCPIKQARCPDGSCAADCGSSTPAECDDGLELCADGTCAQECMPFLGCLPGANNVICPNSVCAISVDACQSNINCTDAPGFDTCWDQDCRRICKEANWRIPVVSQPFSMSLGAGETSFPYNIYPSGLSSIDRTEIQGYALMVLKNNLDEAIDVTGSVREVPYSEILDAGPHPNWNSTFDPIYMTSTILEIRLNGIQPNTSVDVQVFLREEITKPDGTYCMAHLTDWYWDLDLDRLEYSPHADNPIWEEFRAAFDEETGEPDEAAIAAISTPSKRWRCAVADYPRFVVDDPDYSEFKGTALDDWTPIALIRIPTFPVPEEENYDFVQYIVTIAWGGMFLLLLIILAIQILTADD